MPFDTNQNLGDGNIYLDGPQLNPGVLLNQVGLEISQQNQLSKANADYGKSIDFMKAQIELAKEIQTGLIATAQQKGLYSSELLPSSSSADGVLPPDGAVWPHGNPFPYFVTGGFLDPKLITPTINANPSIITGGEGRINTINYEIKDWRGAILKGTPDSETKIPKITIEQRFKLSKEIPKKPTDLRTDPYSQRDLSLIFNDYRQDYFRHGLQILDGIGNPVNGMGGNPAANYSAYRGTPWENNDPIMLGFDIIIDAVSSPLLNGSIIDFLNQYSGVNEIAARKYVYEDFKNQFVKFFRTKGTVRVNDANTFMTRTTINTANLDANVNMYWPGKKAYMGYYLKKIGGLDLLSESNKGDTTKYLPDYRKDLITLDFTEDVSMSVGTLAHLYKLLYWSKPHAKTIIPENLLRFNCDIVISECRNFARTRKNVESGNLEILKDNLSRHVFQLRDCQFWFDRSVINNDIDISQPAILETHTISFDFKYAAERFERFVPTGNLSEGTAQWGAYVGYNGGAIWKIGNAGERENRNTESGGTERDSSLPKFLTIGKNSLNENGVADSTGTQKPFLIKVLGNGPISDEVNIGEPPPAPPSLDQVKKESEASAEQAEKDAKTAELQQTLDNTEKSNKKNKDKSGFDYKKIATIPGANQLQKALTSNTVGKMKNSITKGAGDVIDALQSGSIDQVKNAFSKGVANQKDLFSEKSILQSVGGVVKGSGQLKDFLVTKSINKTVESLKSGLGDVKTGIQLKKIEKEKSKEASTTGSADKRQELLNDSITKATGGLTTQVSNSINDATKNITQQDVADFLGNPLTSQIFGGNNAV